MPGRRPSPVLLLLAFVVLCVAPVGVAAATGLVDRVGGGDEVETADAEPEATAGERAGGPRDPADEDGGDEDGSSPDGTSTRARRTPPPTGMADVPPADRTTTTTTTAAAPPATESSPAPAPEPPPPAAPSTTVAVPALSPTDQVVVLVNAARAAAATPCPPVTVDPRLTASAQGHSDDMAARGYFSHTTPDGVTFDQRIRAAGYPQPGAENIAKGQRSAQQVMNDWMESDGHRRNIENCRLTTIGVGLNVSAWTWTQNFGY